VLILLNITVFFYTSISDYKYQIIPDQFIILSAFLSLIIALLDILSDNHIFHKDFLSPLIGSITGSCIIYLLGLIGKKIYKKDGMGFGDVKLFIALGIFLGFPSVLILLFITIILSGFYFMVLILMKKINTSESIAFGPFIFISITVYLCFYHQIHQLVNWYISLF
jgi:prepilin signal peptidase PulO-like enzyme (type II secretory pathway)